MVAPVFTIGGQDFSSFIDVKSVQTTVSAVSRGDNMTFTVVLNSSQLTASPGPPRPGQIVSFSIEGVKQFEGIIMAADQKVHISRDNYDYMCKAGDYTFLLSSKLVTDKLPAGLAGESVRNLVRKYAPGFGTRFIQDSFFVPEEEFDHTSLGSILNKYAQAVSFMWFIDFDREVHFAASEVNPGPLTSIDLDTENRIGDVVVSENVTQLKNRVFVKDATVRSENQRRDTFVADGNQSFFRLFSPPYDLDGATVTRNGVPVTLFEDTLTTQDGEIEAAEGTCFFCLINAGLRFPINDLPADGDLIVADYFPEEGGGSSGLVIVLEDADSIRMMRQRESSVGFLSDGVHETLVSLPEFRVRSLDPLALLGGIVLSRSAWPEIGGSFTVVDPEVTGWRSGQAFTLKSSKRNLFSSRSFWRSGIRKDIFVYIQSVSKSFKPYDTGGGVTGYLLQEKVDFSSIPARLTI